MRNNYLLIPYCTACNSLDHNLHGESGGLHAMDDIKSVSKNVKLKVVMGKNKSWEYGSFLNMTSPYSPELKTSFSFGQ